MNWKALKETLIPSKEFFILLGFVLGVSTVVLVLTAGMATVLALGLKYLVGETLAAYFIYVPIGLWMLWDLIFGPLYRRYKRISQGQNRP